MSNKTQEEEDRLAAGAIGGGILGWAVGGPPGAIIGGIFGAILADSRNEQLKKERRF